jgi:hypothetical protein
MVNVLPVLIRDNMRFMAEVITGIRHDVSTGTVDLAHPKFSRINPVPNYS